MEVRDFLHELCLTVLAVDRNVRFAGVIDNEGKLLVGEYRKDIKVPLITSSPVQDSSVGSSNLTPFRASYMSLALTKSFEPCLGQLNYQLTDYDRLKLVAIPLTNKNDRYLCVSLDPVPAYQQIIARILDSI